MQPLVIWLDGRADAEFRWGVFAAVPNVKKMLLSVLCRVAFDQADVRPYLIAIIPKVDETAFLFRVMWFAGGEHGYDGIRSDPIECIGVARNNAFEGVMLEDGDLELLLGFAFSGHG